jgi:hypothetical protein
VSYRACLVRRIDDRTDESRFGTWSTQTTADEHREVDIMAATIDIEIESGVYTAPTRRHQGYYAGDFSQSMAQGESN